MPKKKYKTDEERKEALKIWRKKYQSSEKYKEKHKKAQKAYADKNRDYYRKYDKNRRDTGAQKEYLKNYFEKKNIETYEKEGVSMQTIYGREWRKKNPNWKKLYNRKRKEDVVYRMHEVLRSYISRSIKGKIKKGKQTKEIVGIPLNEFKNYIETKFKPGMNWSNYGEWHLDHIKPIKAHDLTLEGELEKCFHYTNFQPLWAKDNYKKGSKY